MPVVENMGVDLVHSEQVSHWCKL